MWTRAASLLPLRVQGPPGLGHLCYGGTFGGPGPLLGRAHDRGADRTGRRELLGLGASLAQNGFELIPVEQNTSRDRQLHPTPLPDLLAPLPAGRYPGLPAGLSLVAANCSSPSDRADCSSAAVAVARAFSAPRASSRTCSAALRRPAATDGGRNGRRTVAGTTTGSSLAASARATRDVRRGPHCRARLIGFRA